MGPHDTGTRHNLNSSEQTQTVDQTEETLEEALAGTKGPCGHVWLKAFFDIHLPPQQLFYERKGLAPQVEGG